jgi:PAS domain S-box-containing protein
MPMKTDTQKKRGFYLNIVLPSALAVLLFTVTLFLIVIPSFEHAMMERKREMIMQLTLAATSILDKYHTDEQEGLLTREDAQQTAISRLRYLRYGDENKDYFWIITTDAVMMMHPYRPELEGQNLTEYKDPGGTPLFAEAGRVAREQGSGYINYMWQWKDDSTHIVPKVSFVNRFSPWGWVIGTGIYIEDVREEIASLSRRFVFISIVITLITALILFYIGRQSFRIEGLRFKAEHELHESREKYRSLVEASTEGLMMVIDARISFVNSILERMTGLSQQELLGKPPGDLIQLPDELRPWLDRNRIPEAGARAFETTLKRSQGNTIEVLANVSPVAFYGREAIIFSLKDLGIDESEKVELFRNRGRFTKLFESLGIGVFRTTLDQRGRFLEANPAALRILGFKNLEELSETYILELLADVEDKKSFRQTLLEDGIVKGEVLKLRRPNGQLLVVNCSMAVISDGNVKFCDGIIEEITPSLHSTPLSDHAGLEGHQIEHQLLQPLADYARTPLAVSLDTDRKTLIRKLSASAEEALLVNGPDEVPVGIITRRDVLQRSDEMGEMMKAHELMTAPLVTIREQQSIAEALSLMIRKGVRYLPVVDFEGKATGLLSQQRSCAIIEGLPLMMTDLIGKATCINELASLRNRFVRNTLPLIPHINTPTALFGTMAMVSDNITKRIITMVLDEMGPPPAPFCFFSLGSDARKEQTLSTDQDNAIIYNDLPEEEQEQAAVWFQKFGKQICTALNEVGYQFCKGNIMAMNPDWSQPVSAWKRYFYKWINSGNAKDLLDINIFFDIRSIYGESQLLNELQKAIFNYSEKNPAYLFHLTQNTLVLKPQSGFWGNILIETAGAPPETVNIKESIMPIVNFARIYALKHQINATGTLDRIEILKKNHIIKEGSAENIADTFNYLNKMRLQHQAWLLNRNLKPDNLISTKTLSELDKTIIKKLIGNINNMLSKLSYDFKGSL